MGMYNAIIPDELLHPTGVYKERPQPVNVIRRNVADHGSLKPKRSEIGLNDNGVRFMTGPDPETDLTDDQILQAMQDVCCGRSHR